MFSSGNTDKLTKPGRKMGGLDALRTSTNEQGVPIPWFCGRARLGITYISRMFDIVKTKVKTGKKGAVQSYKYSAGFAGLIGFGPIDRIFALITQDDINWEEDPMSPTERPSAGVDKVTVTVEGLGSLTFHWGTETQTADADLVYEGIEHPAYRGFAYVHSPKWYLGQFAGGDVPAGNIEVLVGRYPEPPWWDLASVKIGHDINPAAAIWDLLTNPRMNGISADLIDTDSLIALAASLDSEGIGLSPIFTTSKSIRECLIEICQSFDGYVRQSAEGLLTFGLHRPTGALLQVFDPEDMTERAQINPGAWTRTASGSQVRFRNGDIYLNDDVASAFDPANFAVTGRPDAPSIDRPFITDPDTAQVLANAMAQRNGLPSGNGTIKVRKSRIGTLQAGDQFIFHYPQVRAYYMRAIAEAITYPEPGRPEVEVEWVQDNTQVMAGLFIENPFVPPPSNVKTPVKSPMQFGWALSGDGAPDHRKTYYGFAAVAPTLLHNGFFIHREFPDGSSDYVDQVMMFASWTPELYIKGVSITDSATSFDIYLGPEAALVGMLGIGEPDFDSFPTADIDAGKVYLALDAGGFGNPVEIVRVTALAPGVGTGVYTVTVVRGQWETTAVAHDGWTTIGVQASVAMFNREELATVGIETAPFPVESFLLQPAIAGRRADITTLVPIDIGLGIVIPTPPYNLRAFGDRVNPEYSTGQDIPIAWDPTQSDPRRSDLAFRTTTELRIYDATNTTLEATITVAAEVESYTWTNAALITALGSETNFWIRAYQKLDGNYSATYALLKVRLI